MEKKEEEKRRSWHKRKKCKRKNIYISWDKNTKKIAFCKILSNLYVLIVFHPVT